MPEYKIQEGSIIDILLDHRLRGKETIGALFALYAWTDSNTEGFERDEKSFKLVMETARRILAEAGVRYKECLCTVSSCEPRDGHWEGKIPTVKVRPDVDCPLCKGLGKILDQEK